MIVAVDNCFVAVGSPVAIGVGCKCAGNGLTVDGEGGGIKDMERAVLQSGNDLVDLLLRAGRDIRTKCGQSNGSGLKAFSPE